MNHTSKTKNEEAYRERFLSDLPLTADRGREVLFGHQDLAGSLVRIISNCPTPFTIGFFGKWGTGKTTILNMVEDKLDTTAVAFTSFDVWKHEADSLRGTFLKEIVKQLKNKDLLPKEFKLSERMDTSISRIFQGQLKLDKSKFKFLRYFVEVAVLIFLLILWLSPQFLGNYLSILLSGSLVSGFVLLMLQQALTTETITKTVDRFRDPHEFESEFENVIKKISSGKLLVVFDNLDRTSHEKAVELLSTIKTFLEQKKCIFLIACDDEAIKKHLESVYTKTEETDNLTPFDSDEFLRKFFNASLQIPDFIDTELQTYTEDLLRKTAIAQFNSPDVAYVITNAFRDNPRQIKQFINTLLAHFLLAEEREKSPIPLIVPSGTITENVAFLAKFLLVRQLFSDDYQKILKSGLTTLDEFAEESTGNNRLKEFLRATKQITVKDIRPFHYLKRSKEELEIPGIEALELALVDNNLEIVTEKIGHLKDISGQIQMFNRFIKSLITRYMNKKIPLFNIISSALTALQSHSITLNRHFYNQIADILNDDNSLGASLQEFTPNLIFNEVLERCVPRDRGGILDRYIDIIRKQEDRTDKTIELSKRAREILNELIEHKNWLGNKKGAVSQLLEKNPSYGILSVFKGRPIDQKDFISDGVIMGFISSFSDNDIDARQIVRDKTDLLLDFEEIISINVLQAIITKLDELLKAENQKTFREEKEGLLACIEDILHVFRDKIPDMSDRDTLKSFASTALAGINGLGDWTQKRILIIACLILTDLCGDPEKANLNSIIQSFFSKTDIANVKFVFDKLRDINAKKELIDKYINVFDQRISSQQPILDLLYPFASKDTRTQWLNNLINTAPERAFTKLEELKYKVDSKKAIVDTLLTKVPQMPVAEMANFYSVINKMKCANDAELRKKFASQIKSLLRSNDPHSQRAGYGALEKAIYLSATLKREITRETIEWLRSLQPPQSNQPDLVKSVFLNLAILERPVKSDFTDFVFDKLIKRGVDINNINSGFEILSRIKPTYEDCYQYFDDVFDRAETESNTQIKSTLIDGLNSLKPEKTTKRNKGFWGKVEKLKQKMEDNTK